MHPKIAANVDAGLDKSNGQLHFVFVNSREEIVLDTDPITTRLIDLMDGTRSVNELADAVDNEVAESEIEDLVGFLYEQRIVTDARVGDTFPASMTAFERQIEFFADFADDPIEVQKLICDCRVGIVGLGTIGGMVAAQLCRMGIGSINAVDSDIVSVSNLARHALFTEEDIGKSKIDAALRALKAIRSGMEYKGKERIVSHEADIAELAASCDLVINCAGHPSVAQVSEWVGCSCMETRTPHILAFSVLQLFRSRRRAGNASPTTTMLMTHSVCSAGSHLYRVV